MASTVIEPIGTAFATVATAAGFKSFTWAPAGDLDSLPAAVIYLPRLQRTAPDQNEDHISQVDWNLDYPCHLHFDATDRVYTQPKIAELIEAFVNGIDAGVPFGLSGTVQDAKVTVVEEPAPAVSQNDRHMWRVDTRIEVLAFVAQP